MRMFFSEDAAVTCSPKVAYLHVIVIFADDKLVGAQTLQSLIPFVGGGAEHSHLQVMQHVYTRLPAEQLYKHCMQRRLPHTLHKGTDGHCMTVRWVQTEWDQSETANTMTEDLPASGPEVCC